MGRIDALLNEYGESHQNPTNKLVHWICVPVIFWTVMAGLYALPAPAIFGSMGWLLVALVLALIYYVSLSPRLTVGLVLFIVLCYVIILLVEAAGFTIWKVAAILFVLAWIGQFWGHKVEGKKPSFFKDLQFLLVGPAWLLGFLYRRAGLSY
ncbi:DUF962 domain-containing protein [Aliiroseovarius sp. 2305UL8-7]|uniref:Mpo1 family 2-hydroxy fatty acid dioxygenase n=1 Tax=Aliiroseovarius conchicola TaxID=3121637 RepID=UPI00352971C2